MIGEAYSVQYVNEYHSISLSKGTHNIQEDVESIRLAGIGGNYDDQVRGVDCAYESKS